jgi:hypothetical protein
VVFFCAIVLLPFEAIRNMDQGESGLRFYIGNRKRRAKHDRIIAGGAGFGGTSVTEETKSAGGDALRHCAQR